MLNLKIGYEINSSNLMSIFQQNVNFHGKMDPQRNKIVSRERKKSIQ